MEWWKTTSMVTGKCSGAQNTDEHAKIWIIDTYHIAKTVKYSQYVSTSEAKG
jgi:hypothetical protein